MRAGGEVLQSYDGCEHGVPESDESVRHEQLHCPPPATTHAAEYVWPSGQAIGAKPPPAQTCVPAMHVPAGDGLHTTQHLSSPLSGTPASEPPSVELELPSADVPPSPPPSEGASDELHAKSKAAPAAQSAP